MSAKPFSFLQWEEFISAVCWGCWHMSSLVLASAVIWSPCCCKYDPFEGKWILTIVCNTLSFRGSKEPMMLESSESSNWLSVVPVSPPPPGSVKDPDIVSTWCCRLRQDFTPHCISVTSRSRSYSDPVSILTCPCLYRFSKWPGLLLNATFAQISLLVTL